MTATEPELLAAGLPAAVGTADDSAARWTAVLAHFDAAVRGDGEFEAPGGDLGPVPVELRTLAAELLAACDARIEALQVEMDGVADEIASLHQAAGRSRGGGYRATDEDRSSGVGHLV